MTENLYLAFLDFFKIPISILSSLSEFYLAVLQIDHTSNSVSKVCKLNKQIK